MREKQWKAAKDAFTTLVLKEASPKIGRQRIVAPVLEKMDGGITKSFQQLDAMADTFEKSLPKSAPDELTKMLADFSKVTSVANGQVQTLLQGLQQAIDRFKTDEAPGNPKAKENMVRGLKIMKTTLDAIDKSNDAWLSNSRVRIEGKVKALNTFETMASQFMVVLRATLARGLAAAQRIKAKPTKEAYDAEFPKAARDITQQIGNVSKLAGKGFPVPGPQDTSALFNALKPFADGALMKADPTFSSAQILQQVTQFNKAVKAVSDAYGLR